MPLGLPPGWAWTTLGEVATVLPGFGFPERLQGRRDGDFPFLKVRDISRAVLEGDTYARTADNYVTTRDCAELRARPLPAGTIVFAKIGEAIRLNRRAILAQDSLVDNNAMGALATSGLETLFLFYYLTTLKLGDVSRATTVPSVRKSDVESLQLPLAPLPEQRRIVAKIEELFSQLDAGVEELKKAKAQLKRYRQSVLKAAFEGKLTEEWRKAHKGKVEPASVLLERIQAERKKVLGSKYKELPPLDTSELPELPEGWVYSRTDAVGEVVTGTTPSTARTEFYKGPFPFYRPTDLDAAHNTRTAAITLSEAGMQTARLLPVGSTLVTCIGATIGKTGLIRVAGASNQQINAIVPSPLMQPEFVYYVCISPTYQASILGNASSTTLPILNKSRFSELAFPLVPAEEQRLIVNEVEHRLSVADAEEKAIEASLKQAARLRQSILKRAFEGRLVPQDPSDEPAERLLERIRAEKAKRAAGQPRGRGRRTATAGK
jgi:type I restriction enzyme S subunit